MTGNAWIGNVEAGAQTWSDNNGSNVRYAGSVDAAVPPTVSNTGGEAGTLTLISATQLDQPTLANKLSYVLQYTWTANASGGYSQFTVATTNNWVITTLSGGQSGAPTTHRAHLLSKVRTHYSVGNDSSGAHALTVILTVKHTDP